MAALAVFAALVLACGKKGPPLAPLNMAPEPPQAVTARRLGDTVFLQLTVPARSASGGGPFSVDHIDVYAVTLAPGAPSPANRYLLKPEYVAGRIPIRPPSDPDAPPEPGAGADKRPARGDVVTFVETLTPALLQPQQIATPAPAKVSTKTPPVAAPETPAAPAAAAAPAAPTVLTRLYVLQGVASNGNKGPTSARVSVPLLAAPAPARGAAATFNETAITVSWQPPASKTDEAPGVTYNVYAVPAAGSGAAGAPATAPAPLNAAPLDATTYTRAGAAPGAEQCFVVRSVATIGTAVIESDPSDPACVTPRDTFPPAPPKGLAAVSGEGIINLIWDANTDADLAGYIVLRGEAPGDTLQPLTPQPIHETRYVDRTVRAGVAYVYAILAVDTAAPPNQSGLSNKVQETAR